jgi:XTP/dITP diphosphohydrolase
MTMARKFTDTKLVIASHNQGKVVEIADLLRPFKVDVVSAGDLELDEPIEDGDTFIANAEIKARAAAAASGLPSLADDSGLCVHGLDGEPGIYSARWAGPEKDFDMAMTEIHEKLGTNPDRSAHFIAALALCWPDGHMEVFEGRVDGDLVWPPTGDRGFGYDPMFLPDGYNMTFGHFDPVKKHQVSHRADAFGQLVAACFS